MGIRSAWRWRRELRRLEDECAEAYDIWRRLGYEADDIAKIYKGTDAWFLHYNATMQRCSDAHDRYAELRARAERMRELGPS